MKHTSPKNWLVIWMIALFLSFASSLFADEPYAPPTYRGKVILVVDKTMAANEQVRSEIDRLTQDLAGDGWRVLRHDVDRGPYQYNTDWSFNQQWVQQNASIVREIRSLIQADYDASPYDVKAVFLIGHVAVPYSGTNNTYGGHPEIKGAQPTDAFYGEMEAPYGAGGWSDSINEPDGPHMPDGYTWDIDNGVVSLVTLTNVCGDGKFDQTVMPAPMELGVGRVDLSAMPAFADDEAALLCQYLDKDHDFRCGILQVQRKGIFVNLDGNLIPVGLDTVMETILGSGNVVSPVSGNACWFPNVSGTNYLLGEFYTTGDTTFWEAHLMGTAFCGQPPYSASAAQGYWLQHDPRAVASGLQNLGEKGPKDWTDSFADNNSQVVFLNIWASYIGCWNEPNTFLRAPLANTYDPAHGKFGYGLGVIYNILGTDTATLTKRALGATIGEALFPGYVGDITFNLMGDPTLRLYAVLPPSNLTASYASDTVNLSWTASSDTSVLGYNIYCAPTDNGPYTLVNTTGPVTGTDTVTYQAASPSSGDAGYPDNFYMVRTVKLETTPVGSYTNMSEGVITNANIPGTAIRYLQILSGPANTAVPTDGEINSVAFTVDAAGIDVTGNEDLTYQWFTNGVPLSDGDGSHFSGSTTRALLIKGVQKSDEGDYYVVVSLADGSAVPSASASLLDTMVPPTISITSPANGNTYGSPANITITANAADSDGINKVYFFQCGCLIGAGTQVPNTTTWTIPWNNVPLGTYTLTAKAVANNGAVKTSAAKTIIVEAPGTVYITQPLNNTTLGNNVTINANVAISNDGTPLPTVTFYQGQTPIGIGTQVPNTSTWTNTWNPVTPGTYSLTAKATDYYGVVTTSPAVSVTVDVPTVSITSPADGRVFSAPANITITANATDSDGRVVAVVFFQGNTSIGPGNTSTWTIPWNKVPSGTYSLTAKAINSFGGTAISAPVSVIVDAPPTVSITSPQPGAEFPGPANITITATAADSDGTVNKVDFYQGITKIGTVPGPTSDGNYSFTWGNVPSGTYSLTAQATDDHGVVTVSAPPVSVSVDTVQTFSTPGTYYWTCPQGLVGGLKVECYGAGGGGGLAVVPYPYVASYESTGGGGGGAYSASVITPVPGTTYTLVVGGGGYAVPGIGGDTSLGLPGSPIVVAKGGLGNGPQSPAGINDGLGAQGGQASAGTGTTKYNGGKGGNICGGMTSGGGGGGAGDLGDGGNGGPGQCQGGLGGASSPNHSAGNGGAGGHSYPYASGGHGGFPGGGGGGAFTIGPGTYGGTGGNGKIILTYISQ